MAKTITRTSQTAPEHNFVETATGDAPCSIELAMNAKGLVQPTIKLYYPDPATLEAQGPAQLARILGAIIERFTLPRLDTAGAK